MRPPGRSRRRCARVRAARLARAASIIARLHRAPGTSSRISASSSCRPSRVPCVAPDDLIEKGRRQIVAVLRASCRASRRPSGRRAASRISLVGRGVVVTTARGSSPEPQPEHQHVPGLGIAPCGQLVAPGEIVLRTAQPLRLVGAEQRRDRAVRPGQPPLRRLVKRALAGAARSPGCRFRLRPSHRAHRPRSARPRRCAAPYPLADARPAPVRRRCGSCRSRARRAAARRASRPRAATGSAAPRSASHASGSIRA